MPTMTKTRALLADGLQPTAEMRKIKWSTNYLDSFRSMEAGHGAPRSPVDIVLAPIFLMYSSEENTCADEILCNVALDYLDKAGSNPEIFISLLFAFFVAQKFDVVSSLLDDRYRFEAPLRISANRNGLGNSVVSWEVDDSYCHHFEFDAVVYESDRTRNSILLFQWIFPLFAHYAKSKNVEKGTVFVNQGDKGSFPGLAFCDNRPNYYLIPDYIFIPTRGYSHHRVRFSENIIAWSERQPVAMWRGATTGTPAKRNDWRSLERVRMCEILRNCSMPNLFDVGLSSIIQFPDAAIVREIEESGLKGAFIPSDKWNSYKYLIDIDGNSSPWSNLFQKLLSGSVVLKVDSSRGFQQWYYDFLKPWKNYVPISSEFGDMVEKVNWLKRNDSVAEAIGVAGRDLAYSLSYEHELGRSVPVISAAFRYFRGEVDGVTPFGRQEGR